MHKTKLRCECIQRDNDTLNFYLEVELISEKDVKEVFFFIFPLTKKVKSRSKIAPFSNLISEKENNYIFQKKSVYITQKDNFA